MAGMIKLPRSCGTFARRNSLKVTAGEPGELQSCSTVAGQLSSESRWSVSAEFGQRVAKFDQTSTRLAKLRPTLTNSWPASATFGQLRPNVCRDLPTSANVSPTLVELGHWLGEFGRKPNIGQHRPIRAEFGRTSASGALVRQQLGICGATFGELRSSPGSLGATFRDIRRATFSAAFR